MHILRSLLAAAFGMTLAGASLSAVARAEEPTLTVYTYDSFVSEWGPGPAIQKQFEAHCQCKVKWVALEDGAALLSRLKTEGKKTKADVILGLDTNLTSEATATGLLAAHGGDYSHLKLPIDWSDKTFVPYDYGYFAFVYDSQKLPNPPKSLAELAASGDQPKILLEDPRTSTPGLGLLLWVKSVYGDKAADTWGKVAPKVLTISKGWSEAYGLFVKGEAPMVLSYTTSPAYHQINEKTDRYKALNFPEGNYLQIEVAAAIKSSKHADLAKQFLAFLVSPDVQKLIPTTNYMFPVVDIGDQLPPEFRAIPQPAKTLLMSSDDVAKHRAAWIKEWLDTVSH